MVSSTHLRLDSLGEKIMDKKYERMLESMEVRATGVIAKWFFGKLLKLIRGKKDGR